MLWMKKTVLMILDDLGLSNYDDIEKQINHPEMTQLKIEKYVNKKLKDAELKRNQLKGRKTQVLLSYKKGKISEAQKTMDYKRFDNARAVLNLYIKHLDQNSNNFQWNNNNNWTA